LGPHGLLLWSADSRTLAERIANPEVNEGSQVAWCSGGRYWLVGTHDAVYANDTDRKPTALAFRLPADGIAGVESGPGPSRFITRQDSLVCIREIGHEEPAFTLHGHRTTVLDACASAGGRWIASASSDSTIRIWDASTGRCRHVLTGHRDAVRDVDFSADGNLLASASFDGTVRLWDAASGRQLAVLCENSDRMYAVSFMDGENRVAAAGREGVVRVFELPGGHEVLRLHGHEGHVFALDYDARHRTLLSTSVDGTIHLWAGRRD